MQPPRGATRFCGVRLYYTYILSSRSRRLYVGVTNYLERRVYEHVTGSCSFTARYRINRLVHYETFPHPMNAIYREKRLKKTPRAEKIALIERYNPEWLDLAKGWVGPLDPRAQNQIPRRYGDGG